MTGFTKALALRFRDHRQARQPLSPRLRAAADRRFIEDLGGADAFWKEVTAVYTYAADAMELTIRMQEDGRRLVPRESP